MLLMQFHAMSHDAQVQCVLIDRQPDDPREIYGQGPCRFLILENMSNKPCCTALLACLFPGGLVEQASSQRSLPAM